MLYDCRTAKHMEIHDSDKVVGIVDENYEFKLSRSNLSNTLMHNILLCLSLKKALFVKIVVFKTKLFKVDWSGSAR
ncbi:hypothetical protein, partial [Peribacillus sp. YIM B13482]|uniref:hypothetical protein n=1 Tax=Peribacillus sp. YIM B13482 TaxID=3366298 RepID=UPI003672B020